MNFLIYWKWIFGGIIGIIIFAGVFGNWCYEKGKTSVYQDIAASPVKVDTIIKHATLPPLPPVIKWLKPEKFYETPIEVKQQITMLSNNCDSLKALLIEKAKPWETKMDSARYSLSILTRPWTRTNQVWLTLKAVPYNYPEVMKTQIIIQSPPWWQDVLKIGGGVIVGYSISKMVNK